MTLIFNTLIPRNNIQMDYMFIFGLATPLVKSRTCYVMSIVHSVNSRELSKGNNSDAVCCQSSNGPAESRFCGAGPIPNTVILVGLSPFVNK
jgi:hypothetical protein